jgi:hypothetical protein
MKAHICGNCGGILPNHGLGCKYKKADRKRSGWIGKKPEHGRKKVLLCVISKDDKDIGVLVCSTNLLQLPFCKTEYRTAEAKHGGATLAWQTGSIRIEVISVFSWDRWNAARLRNTLIYHGLRTPHHRAVIS